MAGLFTGNIFGGMSGLGAGGTTPGLPASDKAADTALAPVDPSSPVMDPNVYGAPTTSDTRTPLIIGGVVVVAAVIGVMAMMSSGGRRVTANRHGKHGRRRRARR